MDEAPAMDFTTEFVINKPVNIYAEADEEIDSIVANENESEEIIAQEAPAAPSIVAFEFDEVTVPTETPAVEFETSFRVAEQEEPTMQLVMREETVMNSMEKGGRSNNNLHAYDIPMDDSEEQRRKVAERIQKLRNLSFNINNSTDPNTEFDAVPAYVRRNLDLFGNTMASVENYYSKYTVEPDENNQAKLSTINTFLDGKKPD
jgi:cell division protein FtsZ